MKPSIVLIGGGGHCRSCIDVIEQEGKYEISGIVDLREKLGDMICGYKIFATDDDLPELVKKYNYFLITLGQIKSPDQRIKLTKVLNDFGVELPTIVSPRAYISRHASVDKGTVVMHQVIVNAGAQIGKNCIINTAALIEHDVVIGDNCHVSTKAVLNGTVHVKLNTFIGSCAAIRENIVIGEGALIGIRAKVIRNVASGEVVK